MDNSIQNRLDLYINAKLAIKAMRLEEFICTLNDQDIAVLKMLVKQSDMSGDKKVIYDTIIEVEQKQYEKINIIY
ncbi:MAG: hypothetical protein J5634_03950 [Bacilli bacterium]|nr:hypothetical protein [Bacilli bacterium]